MSMSRSQRKKLRSILAHANRNRGRTSAPAPPQDDMIWMEEPAFDPTDPDDWLSRLASQEHSYPRRYQSLGRHDAFAAVIEIQTIFSCGEIQGTWTLEGISHNVFASVTEIPSATGCNCQESDGTKPCRHGFEFLSRVSQVLRNGDSLQEMIRDGSTDQSIPPRELFRPDRTAIAIAELNRIAETGEELLTGFDDGDDDLLPTVADQIPQRIIWDIQQSAGGYTSIVPILQQQKKRGGGYTKGKKIRLDHLMSDRSLPLTESDRAVVDEIEITKEYYYGDSKYILEPIKALQHLVGQDNVTYDRDPMRVVNCPVFLAIGSSKENHTVIFTNEACTKQYRHVIASDNAFVRIDLEAGEMLYGKVTENEANLIRSVFQVPPVDLDRIEELIAPLSRLQKQIPILLPPSFAGNLVRHPVRPAILLRSQSDGRLDFGIRVRDPAGMLRKPLAGPMVHATEKDGKKVQLLRCPSQESETVDGLIDKWGLSVNRDDWFGSISEFDVALRLIEDLQSPDSGIEVLWDRTCEKPMTVLGTLSSGNVKVDITNKRNWFGITGECQLGEHTLSLSELISSLPEDESQGFGDYVQLGEGQWARISGELRKRLKRLHDATHKDRNTLKLDATAAPVIRELVDSDIAIKASRAWQKCIQRLANAEKLDPALPEGLDANLRDYQIDGYKWMRKLAEWGVGGILADDMGLGKTLQTLAVLLDRSDDGPALVIAPTSVGFNWVREAERFAPDLDVHLYRETERSEFLPTVGPKSLIICSYGLALRDAKVLSDVSWSTLVLDEAQAIKNSRSKTSKAIASIDADWTVALTGTPVENHLGELWSLFHVVSPGVFGGWEQFRKRFAAPIEKERSERARHALAQKLKPFVLRRTKSEVLTELPPRTEMNLYVDLSPAERAEYEKVRLAAVGEIENIESLPQVQDQRFKILALMTRLRQISCHAGLVNKQWTDSSAKLDQLCETLDSLREEGHRALVFSQFTEHLAKIRKALDEKGFTYEYLDGSTPAKARQVAVDQFQSGSADVFLISLKAGGTGLNLTAADYVIHMDPWWNPAVEDQATDRAHRMGQEKPVMVYRIVARGTIEEEILALHESKRDLVAGVMEGTEGAAKLSNDDLIRMLKG